MRSFAIACALGALLSGSGCATTFTVRELTVPQPKPERGRIVDVHYGDGIDGTWADVEVEWNDGDVTRERSTVQGVAPGDLEEVRRAGPTLVPVRHLPGRCDLVEVSGCVIHAPERGPPTWSIVGICTLVPLALLVDLTYAPIVVLFQWWAPVELGLELSKR